MGGDGLLSGHKCLGDLGGIWVLGFFAGGLLGSQEGGVGFWGLGLGAWGLGLKRWGGGVEGVDEWNFLIFFTFGS